MASSRLDWVLGVVRLISSASTMLVKSGPGLKTNSLLAGSQMLTPMTSEGSMSEVNWMRWKPTPMERASAAARSEERRVGKGGRCGWGAEPGERESTGG